jgi:hypothetical protein
MFSVINCSELSLKVLQGIIPYAVFMCYTNTEFKMQFIAKHLCPIHLGEITGIRKVC